MSEVSSEESVVYASKLAKGGHTFSKAARILGNLHLGITYCV